MAEKELGHVGLITRNMAQRKLSNLMREHTGTLLTMWIFLTVDLLELHGGPGSCCRREDGLDLGGWPAREDDIREIDPSVSLVPKDRLEVKC